MVYSIRYTVWLDFSYNMTRCLEGERLSTVGYGAMGP